MKSILNNSDRQNEIIKLNPRMCESLVGHEEEYQKIAKLSITNKLHHAIMLYGNRGIGKSTFAYKIATLLLGNLKQSEILIKNLSHPNLMVIEPDFDEIKNDYKNIITIDKIRKIDNFFNFTSFDYVNKVVIVDSVDQLNMSAANGMLKVLEEPPKNTFFLLICHNRNKILDTIKSRCLLFKLKNLTNNQMQTILKKNDIHSIDNNTINYLEGSFANLNWMLDRKNKIIIEDINNLFEAKKIENIINIKNRWENVDENSFHIIINIIKAKLLLLSKQNYYMSHKIFDILDYIAENETKIFNLNLDVYGILLIICLSIYDILVEN